MANTGVPCLTFSADVVAFDDTWTMAAAGTRPFRFGNGCDAELTIRDVRADPPFTLETPWPGPVRLGRDGRSEIHIVFDPSHPGQHVGALRATSDDPARATVEIPVSGRARPSFCDGRVLSWPAAELDAYTQARYDIGELTDEAPTRGSSPVVWSWRLHPAGAVAEIDAQIIDAWVEPDLVGDYVLEYRHAIAAGAGVTAEQCPHIRATADLRVVPPAGVHVEMRWAADGDTDGVRGSDVELRVLPPWATDWFAGDGQFVDEVAAQDGRLLLRRERASASVLLGQCRLLRAPNHEPIRSRGSTDPVQPGHHRFTGHRAR